MDPYILNSRMKNIVQFDCETGGLDPYKESLLAYAFVPFNPEAEIAPLEIFVEPDKIVISDYVMQNIFPKYKERWEAEKVRPKEAFEKTQEWVSAYRKEIGFTNKDQRLHLCSWNIGFDQCFWRQLSHWVGGKSIRGLAHRAMDTYTVAHLAHLLKDYPVEKLTSDGAIEHFNVKIAEADRHTAIGDCRAQNEILAQCVKLLGG